MKIPIQTKIAELERRIEALEKTRTVHTNTTVRSGGTWNAEADSHWREAWGHFNQFFDKVFK